MGVKRTQSPLRITATALSAALMALTAASPALACQNALSVPMEVLVGGKTWRLTNHRTGRECVVFLKIHPPLDPLAGEATPPCDAPALSGAARAANETRDGLDHLVIKDDNGRALLRLSRRYPEQPYVSRGLFGDVRWTAEPAGPPSPQEAMNGAWKLAWIEAGRMSGFCSVQLSSQASGLAGAVEATAHCTGTPVADWTHWERREGALRFYAADGRELNAFTGDPAWQNLEAEPAADRQLILSRGGVLFCYAMPLRPG